MKLFRQFDYFRKSTSPEAIKPTVVGGIISICCLVVLSTLIGREFFLLQTPKITKTTQVSTDPLKHSTIKMNIDIWFPNAPCWLIEIQVATGINTIAEQELQKMLEWSHVESTNPNKVVETFTTDSDSGPFDSISLNDDELVYQRLKAFVNRSNMCRVRGTIEMSKVTANIIFRLKG